MKAKKPRSGKALKPKVRTVRRVTRRKTKTPRRRPSLAKAKRTKSTRAKKPATQARRKPKPITKPKAVRKRVVRKPRAKAISRPRRGKQPARSIVTAPEQEPEPSPPEQAQVLAGQASPVAGSPEAAASDLTEPSSLPDRAEHGEKPSQPETGLSIPPILLEGDEPVTPPMTGPGRKYALGPAAPAAQAGHDEAVLPETYATGKLVLIARDPHWLYAYWDFAPEQQRRYNALSADRHLVLRVHPGTAETRAAKEVHVHPESRHWFVHVDRAGTQYAAELGYYLPRRKWVTVATSLPAVTPADMPSTDPTVRFATIPTHVRLTQLAELAKQAIPADLPPLEAARERALAELVGLHLVRQESVSSAGIPELVGRPAGQEFPVPQPGLLAPLAVEGESISSPVAAPEQPPPGFWLNINAELVIYGATESGANVTIAGRPIQLRPDGTFSCRFSLPDGDYAVTVSALSAQGDLRQAELKFSRHTEHRGEVSAAPQDQTLEPPAAQGQ